MIRNPAISTPQIGKKSLAGRTPHTKKKQLAFDGAAESIAIATWSTPNQFDSKVATFKIRRPYCDPLTQHKEDGEKEREFWSDFGELSEEEYLATASIEDHSSLEMAVIIKADTSVLLVFDTNHRHYHGGEEIAMKISKLLDNVKGNDNENCSGYQDKFQMSTSIKDSNSGEKNEEVEYCVDKMFEVALSIRDWYCLSLLSKAAALKPQHQPQQHQQHSQHYDRTAPTYALIPSPRKSRISEGPKPRIPQNKDNRDGTRIKREITLSERKQQVNDALTIFATQLVVFMSATKNEDVYDKLGVISMQKILGELISSLFCIIWFASTQFSLQFFQAKRKKSPTVSMLAISLCMMAWYYCYNYYNDVTNKLIDNDDDQGDIQFFFSSLLSTFK